MLGEIEDGIEKSIVLVVGGAVGLLWSWSGLEYLALDILHHLALPLITIVLLSFGETMMLMRMAMLETMGEDYVLLVQAVGHPDKVIRDKHVARNAILPVLTRLVLNLPFVLVGRILGGVAGYLGSQGAGDVDAGRVGKRQREGENVGKLGGNRFFGLRVLDQLSRRIVLDPAEVLHELGRYHEALEAFDKAIDLGPNRREALGNKARTLHGIGELDEAIACYDELLRVDPNDERLWFEKGKALKAEGHFADAMVCFDRAIAMDPNMKEAWELKEDIIDPSKTKELLEASKSELLTDPHDFVAWYTLARVHRLLGNNREARDAIDKALIAKRAIDGFKEQREHERPDARVNLGIFEAGVHPAVVPGSARLSLNIVYELEEAVRAQAEGDGWGGLQIRRVFEEAIRVAERSDPWLCEHPSDITWIKDLIPFETPRDAEMVGSLKGAFEATMGREPEISTIAAWADAAYIPRFADTPTVLFGPGLGNRCHTPDECVEIQDLVDATKVLALYLYRQLRR